MAWLDAYIEKCPGFAWEGAADWDTTVVKQRNGRSRRNSRRSQPLWTFRVPLNASFPEHYTQVRRMHSVCMGRKHYFRVRNWLNYKADAWQFGTGDGTTQEFQLGELITIAGQSKLIEVHALSLDTAAPAPVVYVNGVLASATFNNRTGRVLFASPPAADSVLTWSGWFDHWVAFATDNFAASIDNKAKGKGLITNFVVELEEVEAPDETFSA